MCLERSCLDIDRIDGRRVGVISAVNVPQLQFGSEQIQRHLRGETISIYTGLAFYFGALVGETSSAFGCRGEGVAILNDFCSVIDGCGQALNNITEDHVKAVLISAAEAPIPEFHYYALREHNYYCADGYVPYSKRGKGLLIGEGGATLLVGDLDYLAGHVSKRRVVAEIASYCCLGSYRRRLGLRRSLIDTYREVILRCLRKTALAPEDVDLYIGPATGLAKEDSLELEALAGVFRNANLRIATSKQITGMMGAVSGAADIILALECMKNNFVPAIHDLDRSDVDSRFRRMLSFSGTEKEVRSALVVSRSLGAGRISALLLKRRTMR
jgi:3-oxoacyl-(acyl-carrier-protein) synthase